MKTLAIVGGGISGIASAFYATQHGYNVDLYEAEDELGGRIGCTEMHGRRVEFGGKNIGHRYTRFREFATEMGNTDFEPFGFSSSRSVAGRTLRINKDGSHLRTLLQIWRHIGIRGIRELLPLVATLKRHPEQGFLNTPTFNSLAEKLNDPLLSQHFSARTLDNLIRSITVRMNGAEPNECHLGNFGSNLTLVLDSYEQLRFGMHSVVDAFTSKMSVEHGLLLGQRVHQITPTDCGSTKVSSDGRHGTQERSYDHVIVALPAPNAAPLIAPTSELAAELLKEIRYFPVAVLVAEYEHSVFQSSQRAMVFEENSPLSNAGAYGPNNLELIRYTFSGRTARDMIDETTLGSEALVLGESILSRHFDLDHNHCTGFVYRYMPYGLCAYSSHHGKRLERIRKATHQSSGITLTGDYWRGASIEACFHAAEDTINRIHHS